LRIAKLVLNGDLWMRLSLLRRSGDTEHLKREPDPLALHQNSVTDGGTAIGELVDQPDQQHFHLSDQEFLHVLMTLAGLMTHLKVIWNLSSPQTI
jgi:hypothetical protein